MEWGPVKRIGVIGIDQIVGGCVMKSGNKYREVVRTLRMELGGRQGQSKVRRGAGACGPGHVLSWGSIAALLRALAPD